MTREAVTLLILGGRSKFVSICSIFVFHLRKLYSNRTLPRVVQKLVVLVLYVEKVDK